MTRDREDAGERDDLEAALRGAFGPTDDLPPLSGFVDDASTDDGARAPVTLPDLDGPIDRSGDEPFESAARCVEGDGRYKVIGELGRGGMGIVLAARDRRLGRLVAVKVLHEIPRHYAHRLRRFVEEAQISGQLQHPAILPIYDIVAAADERPFFTMRYLRGKTLAEVLAARPDPGDGLARHLSSFRRIAEAVGYAHARGVVHRDLKPSNVMLGPFGEIYVLDWGLAKVVNAPLEPASKDATGAVRTLQSLGEGLTRSGAVMGTPAYMAPEQARGEADLVDRRSDVFALGAILCEILTGRPPQDDVITESTSGGAVGCDAAVVGRRLRDAAVDAELATLVLDCLAADPETRPADAALVARRVEEHESGLEERARRAELEAASQRARARQERRVRRLTQALGAVLLFMAAVVVVFFVNRERRSDALRQRIAGQERIALDLADVARAVPIPDREAAWLDALRAAQLADEMAASGAVDGETRERVSRLAARCETATDAAREDGRRRRRREALAIRLEEVRAAMARDHDADAMERAYQTVLAGEGIDVLGSGAAAAGAALARHEDRDLLVEAIHRWLLAARWVESGEPEWRLLRDLLEVADPDRERMRLVGAALEGDDEFLRTALESAGRADLSASTLDILGAATSVAFGPRRAAEFYARAASVHRSDHDLQVGYALWESSLPSPDWIEVARAATAAIACRPRSAVARFYLARAYAALGRFERAREEFEGTLACSPDYWKANEMLARLAVQRGDPEAAARHIEALLAAQPMLAEGFCLRGAVEELRGRPAEALADYRRAVELDERHGRARINVGRLLRLAGELDEALAILEPTSAMFPDQAPPWFELGMARAGTGDDDEAIRCFERATAASPSFAPAWIELGRLVLARGEPAAAVEPLRQAAALAPDDLGTRIRLVEALGLGGDVAAALEQIAHVRTAFDASDATTRDLGARELERIVEALGSSRSEGADRLAEAVDALLDALDAASSD